MNRFHDRARELESLERSFASDAAAHYVLCARRRLGKTALLRRFAADTPGVYHVADRSTEPEAIRLLAQSTALAFGDPSWARGLAEKNNGRSELRPSEVSACGVCRSGRVVPGPHPRPRLLLVLRKLGKTCV